MNPNLQPGTHPDADQLSVFVEGAATAHEQERMLSHLAECTECRKAAFLMQPRAETQPATATPAKRWMWRPNLLLPVGLPAAALVCGLIAVLIYIRPHGGRPGTPQQIATLRQPEIEPHGTAVPATTNAEAERGEPSANADRKESINSERAARSEGRQNRLAAKVAPNVSGQQSRIATDLNLSANRSGQPSAGAAPQTTVGGPITSVQTADSTPAQSTVSASATSNLALNGRNLTQLQQLPLAGTQGAATQDTLAKKKEVPALQIQAASAQADTLAGLSGRITDRTGAVISGATVTLRDAAGKTRQTTTGTDGSFRMTQLPAGEYQLIATATGFKTSNESIDLKPSEIAMLQTVLDVGAVSETVEVQAAAVSLQTESASVGQVIAVPSGLPVTATMSQGKRFLSLDSAGNLFLSRNGGKKWKKINPQWTGKAVRIELTPVPVSGAVRNQKDDTSGALGRGAVFLLTTDGGTVLSSKDGAHWHQQ